MSLKNALDKIKDGIEDLVNIEVLTFSGTLEGHIEADKIQWDLFKPAGGTVKLVAATRIGPDFDTVNFRTEDADILTDDLVALHRASTEAALSGRASLIKLFFATVT